MYSIQYIYIRCSSVTRSSSSSIFETLADSVKRVILHGKKCIVNFSKRLPPSISLRFSLPAILFCRCRISPILLSLTLTWSPIKEIKRKKKKVKLQRIERVDNQKRKTKFFCSSNSKIRVKSANLSFDRKRRRQWYNCYSGSRIF